MGMGIKFRAWDSIENKMYYTGENEDIHFSFDRSGIIAEKYYGKDLDNGDCEIYIDKLEHLVYMQSIERKDKNMKDIYAGDIVKEYRISNGKTFVNIAIVEIPSVAVGARAKYIKVTTPRLMRDDIEYFGCFMERIEVIGNIYENPELLEVK